MPTYPATHTPSDRKKIQVREKKFRDAWKVQLRSNILLTRKLKKTENKFFGPLNVLLNAVFCMVRENIWNNWKFQKRKGKSEVQTG